MIKAWVKNANTDFHETSVKELITEIEFVNLEKKAAPEEINNTTSWDVSEVGDNSVIAWLEDTKLYIGGIGGVKANPNSSYIFCSFPNVTTIKFGNKYNTSAVTNMSWMFANSVNLQSLDLRGFDTASVTTMSYMFAGYTTSGSQTKMLLSSINTSNFNTSNVEDMSFMFANCSEQEIFDLRNFNTSKVTNMAEMFNGPNDSSSKIKTIYLGDNWDTSKVTKTSYMFYDCYSLETIYATLDFDTTSLTSSSSMFGDSLNIIGGNGTRSTNGSSDYAKIDKNGRKGYFTDPRTHLESNITELESITSDGNQYVMTNIIPENSTGAFMRLSSSNVSSDLTYFGSRKTTDTRFWIGNKSSRLYLGWNTVTPDSIRPSVTANEEFTIGLNYLNCRKKEYNSTNIESIESELTENNIPITIFAANNNGSVSWKSKITLYEFKISIGDSDAYNFVPAYNSITESYGLYDKINKHFYGNSGSGEFTPGEPKS